MSGFYDIGVAIDNHRVDQEKDSRFLSTGSFSFLTYWNFPISIMLTVLQEKVLRIGRNDQKLEQAWLTCQGLSLKFIKFNEG